MVTLPIPFDVVPALSALSVEDREAIAPLCRMRGYDKGEVIFHEGDPASEIHFVLIGRVKIQKAGPGRDLILEILGPGDPVGAVAVYERRPYPATAVALEPAGILSIPEGEFFELIEKRPEITRRLFAGLTLRLMMLNKRMADMLGSVEVRAARFFLTLGDRIGQRRDQELFIPMPLSRQEIADLIGTTIETSIRLMSRWHKEAIVRTEDDGFVVPDRSKLEQIAAA